MSDTTDLFTTPNPAAPRETMNGKPVHHVPALSIINFKSGFQHKKLCDGLTFSTGSACVYSCSFCYVPDLMRKSPHMRGIDAPHESVVIRRDNAIAAVRAQLTDRYGRPKFNDPADTRVIYASPLVDVAGNMELVKETAEICKLILDLTPWTIRLLSKSNLLPQVADRIPHQHAQRVIYGVSTGTLDDDLARAFEAGTPLVSKRLASLHELQDRGLRTFGMVCPSLPLPDSTGADPYQDFAQRMKSAIRAERCEHVWGEVINVRGDSMTRTVKALHDGGFPDLALKLQHVSTDRSAWQNYAQQTFLAHSPLYAPGKLRFLQYVTSDTREWWADRQDQGAVIL